MAGGWTRDGAVQDQIDDSVKDAVSLARALLPSGEGTKDCDECGEVIPKKRRAAIPGVRTCVSSPGPFSTAREVTGERRPTPSDAEGQIVRPIVEIGSPRRRILIRAGGRPAHRDGRRLRYQGQSVE